MKTITFECEVITPMFLAGADGSTPELRPASIKGALRFWWRAMHGHLSLAELKKKEGEIFGGTGEGMGRSEISIRLIPDECKIEFGQKFPQVPLHSSYFNENRPMRDAKKPKEFNVDPLLYLAYGIVQWNGDRRQNEITRQFIGVGSIFIFRVDFKERIEQDVIESIVCLSEFGGLGSKSRNGYGCFKILSAIDKQGNTVVLPNVGIEKFSDRELKNYTTFSMKSSLKKYDIATSWQNSLAVIGRLYQQARQNQERWHEYSQRELIASPLIVHGRGQVSKLERHAKPFFFHVKKIADNEFEGRALCLPYYYIVNDMQRSYMSAIDKMKESLLF